ncbi:hypothetical protein SteCoe_17330 [Stentor coeruleus]|uniref:Uncharacterized protein n=1 Tax=Stentor coeruleus TaxID=5963 RepID=A0A1R2BZ70_9CILI|nr:hypothetical protein SteCoe_17330 [Stentor coeruleus]
MLENTTPSGLANLSRSRPTNTTISRLHNASEAIKVFPKKKGNPLELNKSPQIKKRNSPKPTYFEAYQTPDRPKSPQIKKRNSPKPTYFEAYQTPDRPKSALRRPQFRKTNTKGFSFEIKIHKVEDLPKIDQHIKNKALLDAEFSTNNSTVGSRESSTYSNSLTPQENNKKSIGKVKNVDKKPARYLTSEQRDDISKQKPMREIIQPCNEVDLAYKSLENDQEHLHNEILYRRFQRHSLMKKLIIYRDDDWEWTTPGSPSPLQKVRFNDTVIAS